MSLDTKRPEGCCCPPVGHTGIWAGAMCPAHQGLKRGCLGKVRLTLNPYPIHSPSWWEWERQVGRA